MTPRAFVVITVRVFGLVLTGLALPGAISTIGEHLFQFSVNSLGHYFTYYLKRDAFHAADIGTLAQLGLGLYLLFAGKWVIRRVLRGIGTPGLCPHCGYDVRGLDTARCPECGKRVTPIT